LKISSGGKETVHCCFKREVASGFRAGILALDLGNTATMK